MSKHTKGPWKAAKDAQGYIYNDDEILIAAAHCQKTHYNAAGVSAEQMMANVRLIAASPIMYDYVAQKAHDGCENAIKIIAKTS